MLNSLIHDVLIHPLCSILPKKLGDKLHNYHAAKAFGIPDDLELQWESSQVANIKLIGPIPDYITIIDSEGHELYRVYKDDLDFNQSLKKGRRRRK